MSKTKTLCITADDLERIGACGHAINMFRRRYGERVTLSKANIAAFLRSRGYLAQRAPHWLYAFLNGNGRRQWDAYQSRPEYFGTSAREDTAKLLSILRTQAKLA